MGDKIEWKRRQQQRRRWLLPPLFSITFPQCADCRLPASSETRADNMQFINKTIETRSTRNIFIAKFIQIDFHLSSVHRLRLVRVCAYYDRKIAMPSPSLHWLCRRNRHRGRNKKSSWKCADFYCEILTSQCMPSSSKHTLGRFGHTNLREHLFASSHEVDMYTHLLGAGVFLLLLLILKCYTILERQTNRSIFLFALCIRTQTHTQHPCGEYISIKMHSCILFRCCFFRHSSLRVPGCTETTANGINSKRTQIINRMQHMPRVKPLRNWMKTRTKNKGKKARTQNGTIWARTCTQWAGAGIKITQ